MASRPGSRPSRRDVLMAERALIFPGHRMHHWWHFLGHHLGYEALVLTDRRGEGHLSTVDHFYAATRRFIARPDASDRLLSEAELNDVIARCRTLRGLPRARARAM